MRSNFLVIEMKIGSELRFARKKLNVSSKFIWNTVYLGLTRYSILSQSIT